MLTKYALRVAHLKWQTASCKTISFQIPSALREIFEYMPGQYLTVEKPGDEQVKRCYSICSDPDDEYLTIGVKKVEGGSLSPHLVESLREGDELVVGIPKGHFMLDLDAINTEHYVFIAGGSGITPIRSMISHLLIYQPMANITLIYGNRDEGNIIFRSYLNELSSNPRMRIIHCLQYPPANWSGATGLLNPEKCYDLIAKAVPQPAQPHYFLCGPGRMMENAMQTLAGLGVPEKQIHKEYFTAGGKAKAAHSDELLPHTVQLEFSNGTRTIEVKSEETILSAAIRADIELPYSCRLGFCSSCKLRLVSGKVKMNGDLVLSETEKEEGFILTCQSSPLDSNVVINCSGKAAGRGLDTCNDENTAVQFQGRG